MPSATPHQPARPDDAVAPATYLRLVLLGALVGVPAALLAAGFLALTHWLEDVLWEDLPARLGHSAPPWYLVLLLPLAGAALVLAARTFLPGDAGHTPLQGLSAEPTPLSHAPGIALAALATLACGAVLGPEAPLIALGSAVGVAATRLGAPGPKARAVLSTAGSFSAISALFGGPLVAGMFLIESGVGMGAALIPALLPGLVAAAVGYLLFTGFGDWGGLATSGLTVPDLPAYGSPRASDLLLAVVVGVLAGLLVGAVRALGTRVAARAAGRRPTAVVLLAGGLAVGLLALAARALGADAQDVLFSGQSSIPSLLEQTSTGAVLVLLAAKALAYGVCLGCGFRGGPVFPAVFLGVGLMTLGVVLLDVSATLAVAVGTAAGMAAVTRLLFSPVLFGLLLVGAAEADTVPAAVLAATAAWLTAHALDRRPAPATGDAGETKNLH